MSRRRPITLSLALLALVAAGCGGDDEAATTDETQVTVPDETERDRPRTEAAAPVVEEPVAPVETVPPPPPPPEPEPQPEPASPPSSGGGRTPAYDPSKEDSPRNDKPPPAGSPAERFEQFCEQNPDACS